MATTSHDRIDSKIDWPLQLVSVKRLRLLEAGEGRGSASQAHGDDKLTALELHVERQAQAEGNRFFPGRAHYRLGQQLRAMYDDVVNQGVPDRFTELLDRLNGNGNKDKR